MVQLDGWLVHDHEWIMIIIDWPFSLVIYILVDYLDIMDARSEAKWSM